MRKILTVTAIICISATMLTAQNREPLTFEQAMDITLTSNPEIQAITYEEEAALREKRAAFGLRMPSIGVSGIYAYMSQDMEIDFTDLKKPAGDLIGGLNGVLPPAILGQASALLNSKWAFPLQDRSFGNVSANVTIPLYSGGKINAANNAARINYEDALERGGQSRNALVTQLTERYYGLLLAMQVVDVRKQVLAGMKKHLYDAKQLEANGIIARAERLFAEVAVAEAQRELIKAERLVSTLQNALANTLNTEKEFLPASDMFVLIDIESVDHFKQRALDNNPLLKQVSLKRDLAYEGMRLERSAFAPQIALVGTASLYNYQVTPIIPKWAVGAGVSFKIFDGLNREYKYSAARSTIKQVDALNTKAENDILTLIVKIYNEMETYKDQMPSLDASLQFAEEYLRIKEEAFTEGMAPSSDVVDARLNLTSIRIERLQAAYYYDLMLASLLEACGNSEAMPGYSKRSTAIQINTNNIKPDI